MPGPLTFFVQNISSLKLMHKEKYTFSIIDIHHEKRIAIVTWSFRMGIKGNYQSQDQKMGQKTLPQPFSIKKSFLRISPFWTHKNNGKLEKPRIN